MPLTMNQALGGKTREDARRTAPAQFVAYAMFAEYTQTQEYDQILRKSRQRGTKSAPDTQAGRSR